MKAHIDPAISTTELADARDKAVALRARIAGRRSDTKLQVDAGTLKAILKVVDAVSAVTKTIERDEISPQEAASLLRMSRPSVMRLIKKGMLHPRKVLSRNRLARAEVVDYQVRHAGEQREALENLAALTEEYDF